MLGGGGEDFSYYFFYLFIILFRNHHFLFFVCRWFGWGGGGGGARRQKYTTIVKIVFKYRHLLYLSIFYMCLCIDYGLTLECLYGSSPLHKPCSLTWTKSMVFVPALAGFFFGFFVFFYLFIFSLLIFRNY